jgi:type II secretory pathway component HofQ
LIRYTRPVMLAVIATALMLVLMVSGSGAAAEPLVTNVFEDEDIRNVLRYMSAQTGCSILAEQSVQGWISLVLKDVPLDMALDMITEPLGYAWVKRDGYYLVGTPDTKNPAYAALVDTEVVKLGYVKADAAVRLLSDFFAPNVKASVAANAVVITGTRAVIDQVRQMLEVIDTPPARVIVDVMVLQLAGGESIVEAGLFSSDVLARLAASGAADARTSVQLTTVEGDTGEVTMTWEAGMGTATASFQVTPRLTREREILLKVAVDVYESTRDGGSMTPTPDARRHRASTTVIARNGEGVLVGRFNLHGAGAEPDTTLIVVIPRVRQPEG